MIEFERYAQEGQEFISELSKRLGHEEDKAQVGILLRAVLHTLRDRITIAESFNLIAQLPMFLKAIYVENWKYREKPLKYNTIEEFTSKVKEEQARHGESRFNWLESTIDLSREVVCCLRKYVSSGEMQDVLDNMPIELKEVFEECILM